MTALTSSGDDGFKAAHRNADTDLNDQAIHHTLGMGPRQAAPGYKLKEAMAALEALSLSTDSRLDTLEAYQVTQDSRMTAIESVNTTQNTRLTNIETLNTTQNTRLTNLESADVSLDARLDVLEVSQKLIIASQGSLLTLTAGTSGNIAGLSAGSITRPQNPCVMVVELDLNVTQVAAGTNELTIEIKINGTVVRNVLFGPKTSGARDNLTRKHMFVWDGTLASPSTFTIDYSVPAGSNFTILGGSRAYYYSLHGMAL